MILKTKAFFLFNTIIFNKVGKSAAILALKYFEYDKPT